ncbi:hypothetical protein SAMN05920897_1327 [Alkalispirochaeta americana]|uniref:Uncharacterized protein n=1 Tax=Alkalispirochaeta americana TaxID=159291 RepID=A0A1N6XWE2_9SPIO|nr:hypothetical protein [Alkalispirochaeta americana]SIR06553.1 hypothetical protein SAMN05920897_1327 [Alkalispirochaeta americana]
MKNLGLLGWKESEKFGIKTFTSTDNIEIKEYKENNFYNYKEVVAYNHRIASLYFNVHETDVETILEKNNYLSKADIEKDLSDSGIKYGNFRAYYGKSFPIENVILINWKIDADKLIVIETMNIVKVLSEIKRYAYRFRYDTKGIYASEKEYQLKSIMDSISNSKYGLQHVFYEKFPEDTNKKYYSKFVDANYLQEIIPIDLVQVFGNKIVNILNYNSINENFSNYINYLKEKALFTYDEIDIEEI